MELIEKLRKNKKLWMIIFCAALGIGLILLSNNNEESNGSVKSDNEALAAYTREVEEKIYELCSRVKGVSDVSVAVSFESGFETVYARKYDDGELVVVGSGSSKSAVKVTEKPPMIGGIGVVCRGGGDPIVQKRLLDLLSAAFGISSNKIYIAEAKK